MYTSENYFNVVELQQICSALGLSMDGLKHELVKRISEFLENSNSTRIHFSHTTILPIQTVNETTDATSDVTDKTTVDLRTFDQSTQILDHSSVYKSRLKDFYEMFRLIALIVCFVGSCVVIFQAFNVESVEIPVQRSWFK